MTIKHMSVLSGAILISASVFADNSMTASCLDGVSLVNPTTAFTNNDDGTVTHIATGLTWRQCPLGQTLSGSSCTGAATWASWESALVAAEDLSFAGESDWRLPNINELRSLVERTCMGPSTNTALFPLTYDAYQFWSSTSSFSDSGRAWYIKMDKGEEGLSDKESGYLNIYVVRGGN
jgi:hypothetical protein